MRAAMRAADIEGPHPGWRGYFAGPTDYESLRKIRGVGPARADLILRLYGSIDSFLLADPEAVATRSGPAIGPGMARSIQERCAAAGLRSDWSGLVARVEEERRSEEEPDRRDALVLLLRDRWSNLVRWGRRVAPTP